jgi:hypothetical protein
MDGFHVNFADWDEFTHGFFEFVKDRFMIFKKRTSTKVETRNRSILKPEDKIPEIFGKYAQTLKCTHAMKRQKTSKKTKKKTLNSAPKQSKGEHKKKKKKKKKTKIERNEPGKRAFQLCCARLIRQGALGHSSSGLIWCTLGIFGT